MRFSLLFQGFKGSVEREILVFFGVSLFFFLQKQGLEGQGSVPPNSGPPPHTPKFKKKFCWPLCQKAPKTLKFSKSAPQELRIDLVNFWGAGGHGTSGEVRGNSVRARKIDKYIHFGRDGVWTNTSRPWHKQDSGTNRDPFSVQFHSEIAILSRLSLQRDDVPRTIVLQGPSGKRLCVLCLLFLVSPPFWEVQGVSRNFGKV